MKFLGFFFVLSKLCTYLLNFFFRGDKVFTNDATNMHAKEFIAVSGFNRETIASTVPVRNLMANKTSKSETVSRKTFSAQDKVLLVCLSSLIHALHYNNILSVVQCPCCSFI